MRSHLFNTEQRPPSDGEGLVSPGLAAYSCMDALCMSDLLYLAQGREEHSQPSCAKGAMRGLRAGGERCGEAMDVLNHIDRQRLRAVTYCQFMAWIRREVDPYLPHDVL